ncbi:uncharacterized protein PAC_04683 [Phialocephala subalpina]|uniref:Uncharacterized protein n=1 Tax=Phialocephala subalpina TaxID=576137 RepID=A0A1L7WPU6_9HELO|nr:uncharacterized protein PAC_04683 [Phialocephala subalpina]
MFMPSDEDFEAEYERQKQKLKFFEDAIHKKKEVEQVEATLASENSAVAGLIDSVEDTRKNIEDLKEKIRLQKQDYYARGSEWRLRHNVASNNPGWLRCNLMLNTDLRKEDIPAMQLLIQETKDKAALLEEKLSIAQQSLECKDLQEQLEGKMSVLEEKKRLLSKSSLRVGLLRDDLRIAKETWAKNWNEHLVNTGGSHVNIPNHASSTITTQASTIAKLRTEQEAEKMAVKLMKQKLVNQHKDLLPLATVGFNIRGRKLERAKGVRGSAQSQAVIELGNVASHYGAAAADAAVFQDMVENLGFRKSTNIVSFTRLYFLEPDIVWELRDCQKLMDILSWRGSMKEYVGLGETRCADFHRDLTPELEHHIRGRRPSTASLNTYFEGQGKQLYEKLKVLHEEGLAIHNAEMRKRLIQYNRNTAFNTNHANNFKFDAMAPFEDLDVAGIRMKPVLDLCDDVEAKRKLMKEKEEERDTLSVDYVKTDDTFNLAQEKLRVVQANLFDQKVQLDDLEAGCESLEILRKCVVCPDGPSKPTWMLLSFARMQVAEQGAKVEDSKLEVDKENTTKSAVFDKFEITERQISTISTKIREMEEQLETGRGADASRTEAEGQESRIQPSMRIIANQRDEVRDQQMQNECKLVRIQQLESQVAEEKQIAKGWKDSIYQQSWDVYAVEKERIDLEQSLLACQKQLQEATASYEEDQKRLESAIGA